MSDRAKHTMRDVARLAGVSTSTVSAVLNASVPVSAARKKRVMDAMAALDYHPDAIARGLKTGKTNAIGVVVPDITNAFYPEVVRGVEDAARRAGYAVLLCDSNENAANEDAHLVTLFSRRVDGVLLACCANSTAYATMVRRRFPMVFVDRIPPAATEGTGAVTMSRLVMQLHATCSNSDTSASPCWPEIPHCRHITIGWRASAKPCRSRTFRYGTNIWLAASCKSKTALKPPSAC